MDTITVLFPVCNESKVEIKRSLDSIRKQTHTQLQIIITVDNPKNKAAIAYLKGIKDRRIELTINTTNFGLARNLDTMLAKSKGAFIARMDADDYAHPTRFVKQHTFLKKSKVDYCFCWVTIVDQKYKYIRTMQKPQHKYKHIKKWYFVEDLCVHPALMAKAHPFIQDGYDPSFIRSQDYELWLRAIPKRTFGVVEEVLLDYTVSDQKDAKRRIQKMFTNNKMRLRALFKHMSTYSGNLGFWKIYIHTVCLFIVLRFPTWLLVQLIKFKDGVSSKR
ncbi:MAG: glycosyltransferase involved in cell wall biosynthesis [Candidatus Woesearchaeota archaeon]|jgi:glycosyltransferase involved in cell wall biosynthesis